MIRCVAINDWDYGPDFGKSWCGRPDIYTIAQGRPRDRLVLCEPAFENADEALRYIREKVGPDLLCPGCATELRKALDAGTAP